MVILTRPGLASTSDEGAAILQADLLEQGTWIFENPLPEVDPDGVLQPFPLGNSGTEGLAPFAKHPAYPELLRVVGALGYPWLVLVSIVGTVGAALAGAGLAERIRGGLARPTLAPL